MVKIKNNPVDIELILNEYPENSTERIVLSKMINSNEIYTYDSLEELQFELQFRKEIVDSAVLLNKSGMGFEVFEKSRANPEFWDRTNSGGFMLKQGVKGSDAINDIFTNGYKYGTECATAMTIIYFKAALDVFGEELFNEKFRQIYLMDWDVREPLLREVRSMNPAADIFLGDRQYFSNPDVSPETPELQGENVIVLDNSKYYGHGMGITTGDRIIEILNMNRKEGATQSAYLNSLAGRPDFKKLFKAYYNEPIPHSALVWANFPVTSQYV